MEQDINKIIDAMKVVLKTNLFKEDEDGNMVREHNESRLTIQYRFNFMHSQVRLEQRENRSYWTKVSSDSYKKIKILKDGFIFDGNKITAR